MAKSKTTKEHLAELTDLLIQTNKDMLILKENHLAHIEADLNDMKTQMAVIETRLSPIEDFTRTWSQKITTIFFAAVAASIGIPMML